MLTLSEKIDPQHTAVLVIDVQNDFCSAGGYYDREGKPLGMVREMLPNLKSFLESAAEARVPRVFFQASYGTDYNWYLSPTWLDRAERANPAGGHIEYPVCEEGTWGYELVDGIRTSESSDELIIKKHRYSGFVNTELDLVLRSRGIRTVIVTGVATNVCVESTARDAFMRDYYVVMPPDCCATTSDGAQEATLANISRYFGQVVGSAEIAGVWRDSALGGKQLDHAGPKALDG